MSSPPARDGAPEEPERPTASEEPAHDRASGEPAQDRASDDPAQDRASGEPAQDRASDDPAREGASKEPARVATPEEPAWRTASEEPVPAAASDALARHDASKGPPPATCSDRAARDEPAVAAGVLDGFALALTFLTVIPLRPRGDAPPLSSAAAWFALVGALVGGLAGAARYYLDPLFGATAASVLALVVLVGVTGALHQDGLADCADGLGVRGDRERRLAIMRDPATGAFGTLALIGWALLLVAALAALSNGNALRALVSAAVVGRAAALVHAAATPPARPDGLGAAFAVDRRSLLVAGVTAVAGVALLDGPLHGLAAAAAGTLVAAGVSAWARRALGGRTGDTLGATVALTEVAVCLTLLAFATA